MSSAALTFEAVGPAAATDPVLRAELLDVWVQVTDAGGSVGFVAPAPVDDVAALLDASLARVATGQDALGVLRSGATLVGVGFLADRGTPLCRHWRTVLRVMVRPELQGTGAGAALMRGLHEQARSLGVEHLQLTVRDGQGTDGFYARLGYRVVGRHPGAIRVAPGDDRDEIMMVLPLDGPR